ncbi:MAG TPA: hypothetical protein VK400_02710 [Pyrinomonadaceae bacterium]|nr:hypothetical protein [Pyrinomonadaceae bacterium]
MINVEPGQYYIILAEINTGIVLAVDGKRNITGNTPYIVFDNVEDAERYSYQKVSETPEIECNIYNDKSEFVKIIIHN